MLDRSVSYFLSHYWRNTPLYAEKLIPLLDTCLSSNFVLSDKVANAFYELTNKYQNTADLPLANLQEFIREQGYGYILDLVNQDKESVKALWYLLVLIHQLKGSKQGLLLVLSLFDENFDPTKTTIRQWYEMTPVGRENTFSLESTIDISTLGDGFFKRFENFIANYVYPEMLALKVNYSVNGRITHRPYTRVKINYNAVCNSFDSYNGGSASYVTYDSEPVNYYRYLVQKIDGEEVEYTDFNTYASLVSCINFYVKGNETSIDDKGKVIENIVKPVHGDYVYVLNDETRDGVLSLYTFNGTEWELTSKHYLTRTELGDDFIDKNELDNTTDFYYNGVNIRPTIDDYVYILNNEDNTQGVLYNYQADGTWKYWHAVNYILDGGRADTSIAEYNEGAQEIVNQQWPGYKTIQEQIDAGETELHLDAGKSI